MEKTILPIDSHKQEIIQAVFDHQVVIVVGETGSGKTTRLPQFFVDLPGLPSDHHVGVVEPRRNAAVSTAFRVAEELDEPVGEKISYQVRFDSRRYENEVICFMTTGIMINELQDDPDLNYYTLIMVDEAHERSIEIDTIMACLKQIIARGERPDLRVIIASATIDAQKFSNYFNGAPIINVSGRTFPVEIEYDGRNYDPQPQFDPAYDVMAPEYVEVIAEKVAQILQDNQKSGDIQIFVPGMAEIEWVEKALNALPLPKIEIHRLHGDVSLEEQLAALQPSEERKIIISTNIGETSLTPPRVEHIIDSGFVKQTEIDEETGINSLRIVEHSQAGCNQRAGRAGRVKPGTCYRLFTERNFKSRQKFTIPEIQRMTLENALLKILGIGIENLESFPLLDAPDSTIINQALSKLQRLGAIDSQQKMLPLGKLMARFPLEPELARMLVAGIQSGCVDQVITLAAFISARTVFFRPKEMNRQFEAHMKWRQLSDQRSDFLTYLKIWNQYQESEKTEGLTSGQWAFDNYLNAKVLREIADILRQLIDTVKSLGLPLSSNPDEALIHKCVLAAFSDNLMVSRGENYEHFEAGTVYRHKGTATITTFPKIVVATTISKRGHEVRGEQRTYMDHVAPIQANWVQEVCPQLITNLWNWNSLRFNHFENRLEINQNHVFRQRWYIGETTKPVIPELFTQTYDHRQLQIHFLALLLQHTSQRLQQANPLLTSFDQERNSLMLVSATLARFQISNENLTKLNMFDQALIQKIMRTLNQRIVEQTSAQWEEEMTEIRGLLTECRALITQENLDLVKRHRNPNWRLGDLIDLAEEILNTTNDGSLMHRPRIKENLRRLKINYPILLDYAQNEVAKEVVAQNLRLQKAKLQTRLMEHIKEEYILCPVCNETINISATLQGITSCNCREELFQEMFACTKQNEVILLQTTGGGQVVAELVAKVTPDGYSHELRIFPQRLTLDIKDFTITHYYEPPSEEQILQYRNREQIAQYAKEKAKAEKQVRSGHAIVLTFVQKTTARGEPQWEAINGKYLYVVDKNSEIQPSTEQKRFYCTRAKNPFGHKGNLALIMVTPFLPA